MLTADAFGLFPDFNMARGAKYAVVVKDATGAVKWARDGVFSLDSNNADRITELEETMSNLSLSRNALLNGGVRVN